MEIFLILFFFYYSFLETSHYNASRLVQLFVKFIVGCHCIFIYGNFLMIEVSTTAAHHI